MKKLFDEMKRKIQQIEDEKIIEEITIIADRISFPTRLFSEDALDDALVFLEEEPDSLVTNRKTGDKELDGIPIIWGKMYSTKSYHNDLIYGDIILATHPEVLEFIKKED